MISLAVLNSPIFRAPGASVLVLRRAYSTPQSLSQLHPPVPPLKTSYATASLTRTFKWPL